MNGWMGAEFWQYPTFLLKKKMNGCRVLTVPHSFLSKQNIKMNE